MRSLMSMGSQEKSEYDKENSEDVLHSNNRCNNLIMENRRQDALWADASDASCDYQQHESVSCL